MTEKISIIILNVNDVNIPINRQRLLKWIKNNSVVCCLEDIHFKYSNKYRLKVKGQNEDLPCKCE